ncbi:MAG: GAF domain-containing protein [Sideroxydans sp.]
MKHISEQEFEQALRECAEEPIHRIGSIQPHGALLVLSPDSDRMVLQSSSNLAEFIGVNAEDAFGKPLIDLVGNVATMQVERLIHGVSDGKTATGILSLHGEEWLQAHVYVSDGMLVLELAHDYAYQEDRLAQLLFDMRQSLPNTSSEKDIAGYFEQIVTLVHKLTGYDSVMAYRFDTNWDGEVIAQSRVETMQSYLGSRFPASDIPPQARQLYTLNLVRYVADIDAIPVQVLPALNPSTQAPLDMTSSALRSLSPIHIEYLRNMGVRASMSISLLQNGRLWGLIVCHHMSPQRVSIAMREQAIFISRLVSEMLASLEALEEQKQTYKTDSIITELSKCSAIDAENIAQQRLLLDLQDLLQSTGLIIVDDGKLYEQGEVPQTAATDALLTWLAGQAYSQGVFSCDQLSKRFAPADKYVAIAAGLLAICLSDDMRNCVVWLRKEKLRTIHWAGKLEKGFTHDAAGNYRLNPRESFTAWTELWRGRSAPWSGSEIRTARLLAHALPIGLPRKG